MTSVTHARGLSTWLLNRWPEPLRPHGVICEGDTLVVPVWSGSDVESLRISLSQHVTNVADLHDGDIVTRIFRLMRSGDIECFIDRYGITVHREGPDGGMDMLSVDGADDVFVWRVIQLVAFVQAVLDYQCGVETGRFEYQQAIDRMGRVIEKVA